MVGRTVGEAPFGRLVGECIAVVLTEVMLSGMDCLVLGQHREWWPSEISAYPSSRM